MIFIPMFSPAVVDVGPGSIVFNGTDESLDISSFSSSSPDQKTFTVSLWFKADDFNGGHLLMQRTDSGNFCRFFLEGSNDSLEFQDRLSFSDQEREFKASSVSTGTWTHAVLRVDTTDATASDRVRIYIDGTELSSPSEVTTFAQNDDAHLFTNGAGLSIGRVPSFSSYFDGRIFDLIVVEGQSLPPTDFAYDNAGTWSWKDYEGTFGTHGLRIHPQDSSEIGTDQSGNGYDFTLNNMDTGNFDSGDTPPT